jgi:hypothetical protein
MLNDRIEKMLIKKKLEPTGFTFQTRDICHETELTT